MTDEKLIEEIKSKYGSVSKMINIVENEIYILVNYGGYFGRDGADTLERAIMLIPSKYHSIYYRYAHSYPRP